MVSRACHDCEIRAGKMCECYTTCWKPLYLIYLCRRRPMPQLKQDISRFMTAPLQHHPLYPACQKLPSHHALWDFSTICLAKPRDFWVGLLCSKTKRGLILFHKFVITAIYQQTTQMDLKFPWFYGRACLLFWITCHTNCNDTKCCAITAKWWQMVLFWE